MARGIGQTCAVLAALIGLATLLEYLVGINLGIDQLLFRDAPGSQIPHPGRMSLPAAANFVLLGCALLLLDAETRHGLRPAQLLALPAGLIAFSGVLEYALYLQGRAVGMVLHGAVLLGLLSVAVLLARPEKGLTAVLVSPRGGGLVVRRLVPSCVAALVVIGWLRWMGQRAGLYGTEFGVILMVTSAVTAIAVLIWINARALDRAEQERERAEAEQARLHAAERSARKTAEVLQAAQISLTETLDLTTVLERLLDHLGRLIPYDSASVILPETDSRLTMAAARGYGRWSSPAQLASISFDAEANPILRSIFREGQSSLIGETENYPGWERRDGCEHVRNWMGIPLRDAGRVIGLYSIDKATPHFFSEEHLRLAEALAAASVVAIKNARLFQKAQEYGTQLELRLAEQRRAEEALRESEERFRSLVEATTDWIWEVDANLVYTYASPKVKDLLGYEPCEVVGKTPFELMPPEEAERVRARVVATLAEGRPFLGLINEAQHRDGRTVVLETNGVPVFDAAGRLLGYRGIDHDTTERRRAEEALRESEERFRQLFEEAPIPYHEIDREGVIRRVNRTECELLGYAPEEMIGRPVWEFVVPEQRDMARDVVRRKLAAPYQPVPFHREWLRRDGGCLIVEMHENLILDSQGQVSSIRTATLDISERQRAEEALRASEERYRSLVDNATYGIYRVTADGTLLDVNPAFVEMLGYPSKEDLLTRNIATDIYRTAEERDRLIEQSLKANRFDSVETQFRRRDGTLLTARLAGRVFRGPDGAVSSFEMIAEDVTEHKVLEKQLRQAQKMEAVGRLAGGIAHDFNNILMVIQGYSDLLLEELKPADSRRRPLEEIRKAGERAAALTLQLLAFSRKQVLQPQILDLNAVVSNINTMLRRLIGEDIELTMLPGAGLNRVMADPGQVEQVIMNLAVNARDAMPHGGKLTIETANVNLDEDYARRDGSAAPGPYVRLSVSDTGCGMDAETRAHVFEPFFTTKERGKGTGLGLATVYGIVKQSGGYIWAYSEVGRGTVFKIYLPRAPGSAEVRQQGEVQQTLFGGVETVLVAEDDPAVRALVCGALANRGYTVQEARDGREALAAARGYKGPIHLLLTDVVLPHMSGRRLAERLLAERPESRLLYMSGYTDDAVVSHGVSAGNVPFLQKPFSASALSRKVREVLDQPSPGAGRRRGHPQ
jgi:PAS domain S-box-containing protein